VGSGSFEKAPSSFGHENAGNTSLALLNSDENLFYRHNARTV